MCTKICSVCEMSICYMLIFVFVPLILRSTECRNLNDFDVGKKSGIFDGDNEKNRNNYMNERSNHPISSSEICPVSKIRKGQIIKTNDSIQAGAYFIGMPDVGTVRECHETCCSLSHCNTAVVKVVSICSYDAHKDYKVIELKYQGNVNLEHSAKSGYIGNTSYDDSKEKAGGKCPSGYHKVLNECRENCSNEFYFECANINRPSFKQCIATYDRCDGYQQCDDNSDEINCPSNNDLKKGPYSSTSASITGQTIKMNTELNASDKKDFFQTVTMDVEAKPLNSFDLNRVFPMNNSNFVVSGDYGMGKNLHYWKSKYVQSNNHPIDMSDGISNAETKFDANHITRYPPDDVSNDAIRGDNGSISDANGQPQMAILHEPNDRMFGLPHSVANPLKIIKGRQYHQDGYDKHFKITDVVIDPYKLRGTTLKGSVFQGRIAKNEDEQPPQSIKFVPPRKNQLNWDGASHSYDNSVRVNNAKLNPTGQVVKNSHEKENVLEDLDYAKELSDYGSRVNKLALENKTPSSNSDATFRSSFDVINHERGGHVRKYDLLDFDSKGVNVVGYPSYDSDSLNQNYNSDAKRPQNIINYYKKFASHGNKNMDKKYFKEIDSLSNYLMPSENQMEYYVEYDSDPKRLYDYDYKLPHIDPFLRQKSLLHRISSNYFSPDREIKKVRSGYFHGIPSDEGPSKHLDQHVHNQFREQTTETRDTLTTTSIHSTLGALMSHSSFYNTTSAVSHGLHTQNHSNRASLTKYIELSNYSKHKLENFKGGAAVVLTLGVVLVIISVIVMGYQVQKLRKQGRNRKAKNMDGDTDYLINGLYL